jgi:Zn-dependent oligopeptidase
MEFDIKEKYHRMMRAFEWLERIHANNGDKISNTDARDAAEDFFNQSYHIKDWFKKDSRITHNVEAFINESEALSLAADYCNAFKHGGLDLKKKSSRSGKVIERIRTEVEMNFLPNGVQTSSRLDIFVDGEVIDSYALAKQCMAEWDSFLALNKIEYIKEL